MKDIRPLIDSVLPEIIELRHDLHQHPELTFDCHETAAFITARLRDFGVDELHEGIATSGLVAINNRQGDGPTIGLRADMDALPITEATGVMYTGRMRSPATRSTHLCISVG